jgi:hypothetical protein
MNIMNILKELLGGKEKWNFFMEAQIKIRLPHCDALPTPWGTQMWIPNWKQQKDKESGHAP